LAKQIEVLVGDAEAYEHAQRQALALLNRGFPMGGVIRASRDELTDVLLADVRVWRSYPQIIHHAGWNRKGWTRIITAAI